MVTREQFVAALGRGGAVPSADLIELEGRWEAAESAARTALEAMPGIGTFSTTMRMNAFLAVCRHLDSLTSDGRLGPDEAQLALDILRLSDKSFMKAVTMFDGRASRLDADARADLPRTARKYLALLEFGR